MRFGRTSVRSIKEMPDAFLCDQVPPLGEKPFPQLGEARLRHAPEGGKGLFPWIPVALFPDSLQHASLALHIKSTNEAGNDLFVQTEAFCGHFQIAELVEQLKGRHASAAHASPLPVD